MKYVLKDQELQKKLEDLCGKECVEEALRKGDVEDGILTFCADISDASYVEVNVALKDIEAIEEYDPSEWNNFPAVTPPENVWMRIEFDNPDGRVFRYVARYVEDDGEYYWIDQSMNEIDVSRFRPWED